MKPAQHLLIYDNDCPFCCWYTTLFIRNGLLKSNERIAYAEALQHQGLHFNHDKARNKIAFVNMENGDITYGIDSLLTIFGRKLPIVKTIGQLFPIHWLLSLLYNFLSYNRKIIAPVDCQEKCDCKPDRSILWRFVFVTVSGALFSYAIALYLNDCNSLNIFYLSAFTCFLFQLILQALFFRLLGNKQLYDYIGHLSFVLMIGSFLLIINILILSFLSNHSIDITWLEAFFIGSTVTALFFLHKKRLQLLHASPLLQFTWVFSLILPTPFMFNLFAL